MVTAQLTAAEEIFLRRALPHYLAGKSVRESMEAVLADDNRLVNAGLDGSHGFIGFNDQAHYCPDHTAKSILSSLSAAVCTRFNEQVSA